VTGCNCTQFIVHFLCYPRLYIPLCTEVPIPTMADSKETGITHHPHNHLTQHIDDLNKQDAIESRKEQEAETPGITQDETATSSDQETAHTIVTWDSDDPENPHNWSSRRKKWIVFIVVIVITNSTMGSALPSNAIPYITAEWGVTSSSQKVLPISVYLIGEF
jgi:hypothetical protein